MSTIDIDRPSDEDIKSLAEQGLTLPLTYHTLKHYHCIEALSAASLSVFAGR